MAFESERGRGTRLLTKPQPFHTDMPAEVLALHVLRCAEEGGHTYISSGWTVYNELLSRHPEELRILMTPNWPIQVCVFRLSYCLGSILSARADQDGGD